MPAKLPLKPKHRRYDLTEAEMRALRNVVAFGEDKKAMYIAFVRPDLASSPALSKNYADQFFNSTEARNFITDYGKLLDGVKVEREAEVQAEPKTPEEIAAYSVGEFKGKVYTAMRTAESLDELDTAAKLGDRVGAFDNEEQRVEQPRIYIPLTCEKCEYKAFIEENIKNGNIVDDENS